jgi:hypothetical protein
VSEDFLAGGRQAEEHRASRRAVRNRSFGGKVYDCVNRDVAGDLEPFAIYIYENMTVHTIATLAGERSDHNAWYGL